MAALSKEQKRFLEVATMRYAKHLDDALPYLEGRGLDCDLLRAEGFGVVRDPLPGHDVHVGKLAIPYLTDHGPVNLRFRCLENHKCHEHGHPKYSMMKSYSANLYGVQQISTGVVDDWICVTEGEIDSLVLRQVGIPALGVPGAKMWKEWWPNVFEDFSYVYVFTDGDSAGDEMWSRWQNGISTATIRVKMPTEHDVNSFFSTFGADALRAKVKR